MTPAPFVIEQCYPVPVDKVWKAISDNEQMKQWYFDIADFEPKVGFQFNFIGENEGRKFVHLCQITEVVPYQKLRYSWCYEGFEGYSEVSFELFEEGESTRLKLTHKGLESFPQNDDFRKENFEQGWAEITGNLLRSHVEKDLVKDDKTGDSTITKS
jgi:uncharacterized protein YndB with AHSA1/START domain